MLDFKYIRAELDLVRKGASDKGFDVDLDRLIKLDDQRKVLLTEQEQLRHDQKNAGKEIATLDGDAKQLAISHMAEVSDRIKSLGEDLRTVVSELDSIHACVPMPAAAEVPVGADESGNIELRVVGSPPEFDFEPKDHVELGQDLDIVDFARASKLAGSQTYILKGDGALLELAVLRFALDHVVSKGFTPMIVPTMVKYEPLFGTAYFPGGEEQTYEIPRDDLYLAGTSEVPVTAFHSGEMLEEDQLPLRYSVGPPVTAGKQGRQEKTPVAYTGSTSSTRWSRSSSVNPASRNRSSTTSSSVTMPRRSSRRWRFPIGSWTCVPVIWAWAR